MFLKFSLILALALQITSNPIDIDGNPVEDGLNYNPPNLYEGDIKLTEELKEYFETDSQNVAIETRLRWPRNAQGLVVVPYVFDGAAGYTAAQRTWMVDQLRQIERATCVRFVVRTNQADFVRIGRYTGCWSWIGRIGGRQDLSMDFGSGWTCLWGGMMMHEMLHALGHRHMHQSTDRNSFVSVNLANVDAARHSNFVLVDGNRFNRFNTAYDLRSTVHYGRRTFSNNGQDVIVPNDRSMIDIMGNVNVLSAGDALRINRQHQC